MICCNMDTRIFLLLTGILFPSVLCMYVQNEVGDYEMFEVPLRPRFNDSDGQSAILDTDEPRRLPRSSSSCRIPQQLDNSNLSCISYPSKMKCIQSCMFGYTFSEGRHRVMVCDHSTNMWSPIPEFESCEPFIDCGVTLSSGGKIRCKTHFMEKGTICEISCDHYEDKPAIPPKFYGCNMDGSWTPELPFCARAGSGLALVPPPRRITED